MYKQSKFQRKRCDIEVKVNKTSENHQDNDELINSVF